MDKKKEDSLDEGTEKFGKKKKKLSKTDSAKVV